MPILTSQETQQWAAQCRGRRIAKGCYQLEVGSKRDKTYVTVRVWFDDAIGGWVPEREEPSYEWIVTNGPWPRYRDIRAAFAYWATKMRDQGYLPEPPGPRQPGREDTLIRNGPPRRRKPKPTKYANVELASAPVQRTQIDSLDNQFASDPLDPECRYDSDHPVEVCRRQLTPYGVLIEVAKWYERHRTRLETVDRKLQAEGVPGYSPLRILKEGINACLERERARVEYRKRLRDTQSPT